MYSRRKFVQTLTTGTLAAIAVNPLMGYMTLAERKLKNIGFIEGIIGEELKGDWKTVLKETVGYGYSEIEIGRYLGSSATSFLQTCNEIGIKPVAGGTVFSKNMDEVNKSLDELNLLELKYAVIYWPWLGGGPFKLEDCKVSADMLNLIGEQCKNHGLTLCWHNHNKEFIQMEEELPFDYLMNNTEKDLVKCEMDIYWVKKGGADPVKTLKMHEGRYAILHVKDMAEGKEEDFACTGSGIIDFPSVFSEAVDQGISHYFVERDNVVNGMFKDQR
ncbi:MAG TPA: sugar phosphate isomerase/epimerase [Bacteroidales bacterium]|nr:sugar phosphate isomerase/epimerase [Bacteroidales bacterium]